MGYWETTSETDEWYTPPEIFKALGCEFDLDVAAPKDLSRIHVPAKNFLHSNALDVLWSGYVWLNPPFGGRNSKRLWLNKMHAHGNGIALVPDRSSTTWWQNAARECDAFLNVHGKIKFLRPDGTTGDSPSTGTTLFGYGEKAVEALINAERNNLGVLLRKYPFPLNQ